MNAYKLVHKNSFQPSLILKFLLVHFFTSTAYILEIDISCGYE